MKSKSPFKKTDDCSVRYKAYVAKNSKDLLSKEKYCANTRDKRIKKEQDK